MDKRDIFQIIDEYDIEGLYALLQQGIDVNIQSISGTGHWTPLQDAIASLDDDGYSEPQKMIELLIRFGADVNLSFSSYTPLIMAIADGHDDIAELLLDAGADPNNGNDEEEGSALNMSVYDENIYMVGLLLNHGATEVVDRPSGIYGKTPLGIAVKKMNVPIIKMLLDAGADPEAIDRYRYKPIEWLPKSVSSSLKTGIQKMIERATHERKEL